MNHVDLETLVLSHGGHDSYEDGHCVMEAVAYFAHEKHGDHPNCVSPVIGEFLRSWNDVLRNDEDRNRLLRNLIPLVVGTNTGSEDDLKRSWLALDWLARVNAPAWLDLAGLAPQAAALRDLGEIRDGDGAERAMDALRDAREKATAARDAAWDTARAAAWDAARDATTAAAWAAARAAARDTARAATTAAAWAAAWDAAWAAAWDAARAATRAAAWAAAEDKLAPTVAELQESAQELVRRMAAVGAEVAS